MVKKFGEFIKEKVETQGYLGGGGSKVVYPHPDKPDRVWGVIRPDVLGNAEGDNQEVEKVKATFYLTKILHMLFPKNIPDVSMVTTEPESIVRQKIDTSHIGNIDNPSDVQSIYEFDKLLGELGIIVDDYASNHAIDSEGNVIYFDDVYVWSINGDRFYDQNKLRKAIKEKLSGEEQTKALTYLDRIESLRADWLKLKK
jgi:hypothetical protein